jgi:hypothetical protein
MTTLKSNFLYRLLALDSGVLIVDIPCRDVDRQISSLEQIYTACSPPLSTLDDLYIFALALAKQHRKLSGTETKHWNFFLEACLVV